LINNPSLLLADEPTGNLDTRTSHEIMKTLQRLNRERGVTIIVVTHEPDISSYADRTITMRDGEVISDERQSPMRPVPAGSAAAVSQGSWMDERRTALSASTLGRSVPPGLSP
jgi:ABC-type glutathione transport system ATPase component